MTKIEFRLTIIILFSTALLISSLSIEYFTKVCFAIGAAIALGIYTYSMFKK